LFFWNFFLLFLFNVCFRFFFIFLHFLLKKIGYFLRIFRKSRGNFLFFLKYFCYDYKWAFL
jgi:hypothetical protein